MGPIGPFCFLAKGIDLNTAHRDDVVSKPPQGLNELLHSVSGSVSFRYSYQRSYVAMLITTIFPQLACVCFRSDLIRKVRSVASLFNNSEPQQTNQVVLLIGALTLGQSKDFPRAHEFQSTYSEWPNHGQFNFLINIMRYQTCQN